MATLEKNAAQEEAVRTIYGPVLIASCPGSGKTTTLIRRIHHMIEEGISPSSILMVTFSSEAAKSMMKKYVSLYGENPGITFATIHSFCYHILLRHGGYNKESLLTESDAHQFIEEKLNVPYGQDRYEIATAAKTAIGIVKNNRIDPETYKDCEGISPDVFRGIYYAYEDYKSQNGFFDFDDMLTACLNIFDKNPSVLKLYQNHFRFIQCDEYQDVNITQRDILYALAGENQNLCVVGDDDQSIYAFRGSRPEIMMSFGKDFPNAKIIKMGMNYRSGQRIVERASTLIEHNKVRIDKDFRSFRGEHGFSGKVESLFFENAGDEYQNMIELIQELHRTGTPYSSIAILFRTNDQMTGPATALSDAKIPYYTTEHVKTIYESIFFRDIKHYMALATGSGDSSDFISVLNHPNRYLKASDFENVPYDRQSLLQAALHSCKQSWQYDKMSDTIWNWMDAFGPGEIGLSDSPKKLAAALRMIHYSSDFLIQYAKYRNFKETDVTEDYDRLMEDAKQFATIGDWFAHAERTVLRIQMEVKKRDTEGVVLTTMHRSKGLEWPVVFIPDVNVGIAPHRKSMGKAEALEEERRLFYVAMTRAMDTLYILALNMKSSRYLLEMEEAKKKKPQSSEMVPMKLKGAKVIHKKYGEGSLVTYMPGKVRISFDGTMRDFQFPNAFVDGHLQYK